MNDLDTSNPTGPESRSAAPSGALLTKGNPLRRLRGGITAALDALFAFLLMAHNAHLSVGVPLGALFVAIAAWGVMDFFGTYDDAPESVVATVSLRELRRPFVQVIVASLLFAFALAGAASGLWAQGFWGAVVTIAFVGLVASVFDLGAQLGPWRVDEAGEPRPLLRRHGFWLVVIASLLYLPMLGSFSLWDPWETHYGEVAREILARDDWISLWWAQDGWFWSKPVLDFWIQAIAMATLRTHYQPDKVLEGVGGPTAHPEWVVRAPNFLLTVVGMYFLYKGVAKIFGRRAGLLGGLVLATAPDWYFLAHQTMTDMPFVAAMTAAMGLLAIGLHTDEGARVRLYELRAGKAIFRISGWHLVFGAILLCALPQILYLLSRNLELVLHGPDPHGFRTHWDEFRSGSGGGNCGLPGNENCALAHPASLPRSLGSNPEGFAAGLLRLFGAFEPILQGLVWAALLGALLYLNWGERRVRRLAYLGAWFFAAIATLAKGPAGFALPMICAFAYICTTKKWTELTRLELVSGLLVIAIVALPWYVAMYVRHGSPFTDRLIFHDMFNRAFHHVHDTNEGDDTSLRYYVWQLGYALFPWIGLAPLGLLYWLRRSDAADQGRADVSILLFVWFLFAFALFSFMGTKFHHYIFPAIPPIAMLIGVVLEDVLRVPKADPDARATHERLLTGAAAVAGAFLVALVGRDLVVKPEMADQPGAIRLLHLFTYNYRRPWPDSLDFTAPLALFSALAAALLLAFAVGALRRKVASLFMALAVAWAAWGLDVYMIKTAPHWGQHEVIETYYRNRRDPTEPLVAYQMNWKGENFYTGNHVPAFVSSGSNFTNWIKQQRDKGVRVMYFITEHSRVGGLRNEAGAHAYQEITNKALCNKFVLVRAEL